MGPWNPTQGQIIKVKVPEEPVLKYKHEGDTWRWNCGHQISAQIKIRQLFLLPAVSRVSLTLPPHCPSVHTTAPVIHLDVLSTLKRHQLKGRTNQSVTGEHVGITIERSSEDANICYASLMFFTADLCHRSIKLTVNRRKRERFRMKFWCHRELATMSRLC